MTENLEWLRSRIDSSSNIRLGLREYGEKIAPRELKDSIHEDRENKQYKFILDEESTETRHNVGISGDNLNHEESRRHVFTLTGNKQEKTNVELVLETPASEGDWWIGSKFTIDRRSLSDIFSNSSVQPISPERVAGLDQQKERLRRFLNVDNNDWGMSSRAGILLEGPPGTGKTELVIEMCEELFGGMPVTISGPEILSKWVGESERLLRRQFEEARNSRSQVLYIDEIDAIARSRSETTHEHSAQLVAQLLVLLDGVNSKKEEPVKVIASTNLAEVLDAALLRPGRLGNQPIDFPRPNQLQRMCIFHHYLEKVRRSDEGNLGNDLCEATVNPIDSVFLQNIAEKTEGYTGADIEDVIIATVTQIKSDDSEDKMGKSRIERIVQGRDVQQEGPSFTERDVRPSDSGSDTVQLDGEGKAVRLRQPLTEDELNSIAREWSARFNKNNFVIRSVQTKELIGSGLEDTRDKVISVFQHDSDTRLCLHLGDFSFVARASDKTPLADVLIEAIHEGLVRWDEENILIYEHNVENLDGIATNHLDVVLGEKTNTTEGV
jgi:transitional endoplasmic reticulum ATPase